MVDNNNPTNQFHPYQAPDVEPQSSKPTSGWSDMLKKVGVSNRSLNSMSDTFKNVDVQGAVDKFRGYAKSNPGMVLGGLAAVAIGAGLLRGRR